jgi:hypothetical protein
MNRTELALLGSGFVAGILSVIIVELLVGRLESMAPHPQVTAAPPAQKAASSPPSVVGAAPAPRSAAAQSRTDFFPSARKAITGILRDPDSAQFGKLFEGNRGSRTICGEVNAKNGYGGYTGMTPFVYFPDTGQGMLITNPPTLSMTSEGVDVYFRECQG